MYPLQRGDSRLSTHRVCCASCRFFFLETASFLWGQFFCTHLTGSCDFDLVLLPNCLIFSYFILPFVDTASRDSFYDKTRVLCFASLRGVLGSDEWSCLCCCFQEKNKRQSGYEYSTGVELSFHLHCWEEFFFSVLCIQRTKIFCLARRKRRDESIWGITNRGRQCHRMLRPQAPLVRILFYFIFHIFINFRVFNNVIKKRKINRINDAKNIDSA